jgi:hypothetical protein
MTARISLILVKRANEFGCASPLLTSPDIGGVDATSKRSREASFNAADGVVENGTTSLERILKHFVNPNHPRLRRCCGFASLFFMAQPPLLCQEGNCQPEIHSIHSQFHRTAEGDPRASFSAACSCNAHTNGNCGLVTVRISLIQQILY